MAGFFSRWFGGGARKRSRSGGSLSKRIKNIEVAELHEEVSLRHKGLWSALYTTYADPPGVSHHLEGIRAHTRYDALDIAKAKLKRKGFDVSMRAPPAAKVAAAAAPAKAKRAAPKGPRKPSVINLPPWGSIRSAVKKKDPSQFID
jgi:hypothetical protein